MGGQAVVLFYLIICAAITGGTVSLAKKKGRDPVPAGMIAGILSLIGIVGGLITLAVYAAMKPKINYCPKCGEPNIFFLPRCRRCDTFLQQ